MGHAFAWWLAFDISTAVQAGLWVCTMGVVLCHYPVNGSHMWGVGDGGHKYLVMHLVAMTVTMAGLTEWPFWTGLAEASVLQAALCYTGG
jgi:hypothetical protein